MAPQQDTAPTQDAVAHELVITPSTASQMTSAALGLYVRDGLVGIAKKLVELKPYVIELWLRFDSGETILGCSTRKQFCEDVLKRSPRAVRYMLAGGNPDNAKQREEIISSALAGPARIKRIQATGDPILAALVQAQTFSLLQEDEEQGGLLAAAYLEGLIIKHISEGLQHTCADDEISEEDAAACVG